MLPEPAGNVAQGRSALSRTIVGRNRVAQQKVVPVTTPTRDIETRDDIANLMRTFYSRMFEDEVMGPIFVDVAKMDLEAHIPVMCDFWELQLFQKPGYRGGMMAVHFRLHMMMDGEGLEHHHFMRWMDYWESTLDDLFEGPRATWAKTVASRVGRNMSQRIDEVSGRAVEPITSQIRFR